MTDELGAAYFYGIQSRIWDRLYRIYVCDRMIAGAYVAGQIYDEQTAALILQQSYLFLRPWVRRWLQARRDRETLYDGIDPFAPEFIEQDSRNFQIERTDVLESHFRRNRVWHTPDSNGVVELILPGRRKLRLIVQGDQNPEQIERLLRVFDSTLLATGQSTPRRLRKPVSPTQRRRFMLFSALMLFGFGAFFGFFWLQGAAGNPGHGVLAAANFVVGLVCLWRGRKPRLPRDDDRHNEPEFLRSE